MFTTPEILLIIGAVSAGAVSIINALKSRRVEDAMSQLSAKAAVIEGHVNSASTAAAAREEAYRKEVATLHSTVAGLHETAALLAQAAAHRAPTAAARQAIYSRGSRAAAHGEEGVTRPPLWRLVVIAKRVFYWPATVIHNYQVRRFWRIARQQEQVARRLAWRLKQQGPTK
jgi:hypothetical protein